MPCRKLDELKSIFCSSSQLGAWREMRWQDRDQQCRGELIKRSSVQCLWCQVLTVDTRHVTRYYEINLNSFKSHSQCLYWPLILKLSLKEMMNYFTDDDNVSLSCHISPWLSVPGQLNILADCVSPPSLLDLLTSCTRLTLRVSSVQCGPGCTLVPILSATSSPQQPMGGQH